MTIQNGSETKLNALRLTVRSQRWTYPTFVPKRHSGALQARFYAILHPLCINCRETRIRLTSAIVGREINSFSDLLGGEVNALLEEPYLKEILHYMLEKEKSDE